MIQSATSGTKNKQFCCWFGIPTRWHHAGTYVHARGGGTYDGPGLGRCRSPRHEVWRKHRRACGAEREYAEDSHKFGVSEPFSRPIISADPNVIVRIIQPSYCFNIFASDCLWEYLSYQEDVEIVHNNQRPVRFHTIIFIFFHTFPYMLLPKMIFNQPIVKWYMFYFALRVGVGIN